MDSEEFQPVLQWLRRQAVRESVAKIAPPGSHFWHHLDRLIWGFLRFAICVPRDCPTIAEALERLSPWPVATILVSAGTYHESVVIDKPVELVGRAQVTLKGISSQPVAAVRGVGASLYNLSLEGGVEVEGAEGAEGGRLLLKDCALSLQGVTAKGSARATLQDCAVTCCQRTACILRDEAVVKLNRCSFESNLGVCISARERASVTTCECTLQRNAAPVMQFRDDATAEVRSSCLRSNKGCGVLIRGKAKASIESCELRGHKMAAVSFLAVE